MNSCAAPEFLANLSVATRDTAARKSCDTRRKEKVD